MSNRGPFIFVMGAALLLGAAFEAGYWVAKNYAPSEVVFPLLEAEGTQRIVDPFGPSRIFVNNTAYQQTLSGELVSFTGNSWTLKKGNRQITVRNEEPNQKIAYYVMKSGQQESSRAADLKVGEEATIFLTTDLSTGHTRVNAVFLNLR